jgi:hypothetical protein
MGLTLLLLMTLQLLCLQLNLTFNSHTSCNVFQVEQQLNLVISL